MIVIVIVFVFVFVISINTVNRHLGFSWFCSMTCKIVPTETPLKVSSFVASATRVKLCSWTLPITGLRLWTLESLWVQCCWILAKRLTFWIMTYCYPKLTNIMSLIHLKIGFNHTLVIEHNVAHCLSHCLTVWFTGAGPRSSSRINFGPNIILAVHQWPSNWNIQLKCRHIWRWHYHMGD